MSEENNDYLPKEGFTSVILASLKGISQIVFIENAISGLIILIAITISSYTLGIIALLSSIIGTVIGKIGGAPANSIRTGLYAYNSVLTGMAITLFLTGSSRWIIALIGAMIAAIFAATIKHFMNKLDIPIATFPFIILTWFLLLVSYQLKTFHLSESLVPQSLAYFELNIEGDVNWVEGFFDGIGQVFFVDGIVTGVLLYIAVFWASWRLGLYALIGSALALLIAYGLGGEHSLITHGLYGYNAILTCMAVTFVFSTKSNRFRIISGIVATCLTVPLTASITTLLLPYGLPALTLPYVLCTWLFLGARKVLPKL